MDWDKIRIFYAVADAGSLTHAGDKLHLSQSAISRQIHALEASMGATLFHRHARGLILTEQGELLFDAAAAMGRRLDFAAARIKDTTEEVFGKLRVTTTTGFGSLWLAPRLPQLYEKYPGLNVDLMLEERVLDLPMREADVAIRLKEPSQADLIRKRLMSIRFQLCATQSYLSDNRPLAKFEDLVQHRLICQSPQSIQATAGAQMAQKILSLGVSSLLTVNNYFGVLQGVANSLGVGVLPDYVIKSTPSLIRVLPKLESHEVPVYLAYPEELRSSKRIGVFRDFVQEEIIAYRKQLRGPNNKPAKPKL